MTDETLAGDEPVMTGEILPENDIDTPPAPEPTPEPAPEPAVEAEPQAEAEPAPEPEPEAKRSNKGLAQRFAALTAKNHAEATARQQAEARAATLEALVRQLGGDLPPAEAEKPLTAETVEQRAREIVQERETTAKLHSVRDAGSKAFGGEQWDEAVQTLAMLGLIEGTGKPAFEAEILATEAPEKIIHHLAQDPDEAMRIAQLPQVTRVRELTKLEAKLLAPPAPKPKPVSAAPAPIEPIGGPTDKGFDPLDENMPIEAWAAEMDRRDAERRKRQAERGY